MGPFRYRRGYQIGAVLRVAGQVCITLKGLRSGCPQDPPFLKEESNRKKEGFDEEARKEGLRFGCRTWSAKRVQSGTG